MSEEQDGLEAMEEEFGISVPKYGEHGRDIKGKPFKSFAEDSIRKRDLAKRKAEERRELVRKQKVRKRRQMMVGKLKEVDQNGLEIKPLNATQEAILEALLVNENPKDAALAVFPEIEDEEKRLATFHARKNVKAVKHERMRREKLAEQAFVKNATWTREQATEVLKKVIDVNRMDMDRISNVYEMELSFLQTQLRENPDQADKFIARMIANQKERRASQVNNRGITEAVAELNKMNGFNEETVNLNSAVVFTGADALED